MRRLVLASLAVVIVGISGLALAASVKREGTFSELQASGISGEVRVHGQAGKETLVQIQARNLQPEQEYRIFAYTNTTCGSDPSQVLLATATPNKQGMLNWNGKIIRPVEEFGSVSLVLVADDQAKACAENLQ